MFIFGQFSEQFNIEDLKEVTPYSESIYTIIDRLSELADIWGEDGPFFSRARELLVRQGNLSDQSIVETLQIIPCLFSKKALLRRVEAEFESVELLDSFCSRDGFEGKIKAIAHGTLLHITAGNVFLGAIDSMLMGILTKNINIIKLSSRNDQFARLFCESLLEVSGHEAISSRLAMISWRGGVDNSIENQILGAADTVVLWGGEQVVMAYKSKLRIDQKLVEFGPKLSFGVLYKDFYDLHEDLVCEGIAKDLFTWGQSACSNAQTFFVESVVDINEFISKLKSSFETYQNNQLFCDENEQVERLKEKERLEFSKFSSKVSSVFNNDFIISYKGDEALSFSILNQTIHINLFSDLKDLKNKIRSHSYYLQTCALGSIKERSSARDMLFSAGIKRLTDIGKMTEGLEGAPHDGRFALRELVHFVIDEGSEHLSIIDELKKSTEYFQDHELVSDESLRKYNISKSNMLLNKKQESGLFFTSGGSTGEPKYCSYSYRDFDKVTGLLADNFSALAMTKDDVVANLFMAGNMWSSFLSTFKVIEKVGASQLPIAGALSAKDCSKFLLDFKATVLVGVPTKLLEIARFFDANNLNLALKAIFYAGERLSEEQCAYLKKVFKCSLFSAGYAGVDTGLIAVQGVDCKRDEHVLLDGVDIKMCEDGKLHITSSLRHNMPVINYELGDKVSFDPKNPRKLRLEGRSDKVIQLWGCRFLSDDLVSAVEAEAQFIITKDEVLLIKCTNLAMDTEKFSKKFRSICEDVRKTLSQDELVRRIELSREVGSVNKKTGKTPLVIDERF